MQVNTSIDKHVYVCVQNFGFLVLQSAFITNSSTWSMVSNCSCSSELIFNTVDHAILPHAPRALVSYICCDPKLVGLVSYFQYACSLLFSVEQWRIRYHSTCSIQQGSCFSRHHAAKCFTESKLSETPFFP